MKMPWRKDDPIIRALRNEPPHPRVPEVLVRPMYGGGPACDCEMPDVLVEWRMGLIELAESPLPGARYAYTVMKARYDKVVAAQRLAGG